MIVINEAVSNREFREVFDNLSGSTQDKIDQVSDLINRSSKGLKTHNEISQEFINNHSKNDLLNIVSDICYSMKPGQFIKVNNHLSYYCYQRGLANIGYLYNIAKGAMTARNVFGSVNYGDAFREIRYLIEHGKFNQLSVLS